MKAKETIEVSKKEENSFFVPYSFIYTINNAKKKDKNIIDASNLQSIERNKKKLDTKRVKSFLTPLDFSAYINNNNDNTPNRIEGTSANTLNERYKVIGRNINVTAT